MSNQIISTAGILIAPHRVAWALVRPTMEGHDVLQTRLWKVNAPHDLDLLRKALRETSPRTAVLAVAGENLEQIEGAILALLHSAKAKVVRSDLDDVLKKVLDDPRSLGARPPSDPELHALALAAWQEWSDRDSLTKGHPTYVAAHCMMEGLRLMLKDHLPKKHEKTILTGFITAFAQAEDPETSPGRLRVLADAGSLLRSSSHEMQKLLRKAPEGDSVPFEVGDRVKTLSEGSSGTVVARTDPRRDQHPVNDVRYSVRMDPRTVQETLETGPFTILPLEDLPPPEHAYPTYEPDDEEEDEN